MTNIPRNELPIKYAYNHSARGGQLLYLPPHNKPPKTTHTHTRNSNKINQPRGRESEIARERERDNVYIIIEITPGYIIITYSSSVARIQPKSTY